MDEKEVIEEVVENDDVQETTSLGDALKAAFDQQTAEESTQEPVPEEEVEASDEVEASEETETSEKPKKELTAPEHWSDEDKSVFEKLDDEGRKCGL
jgi:uncharacterized membrane protein (UPF0182 family)